jgi:GTP pyrophosphokinase
MNHDIRKFQFFELLQELSTLNISNDLYNKEIKEDLLNERIYVYTPKKDIIELPEGATPVDFAYKIHTDIGDTLIACKVNGKEVPLDTPLNNEDTVEVECDFNLVGPRVDYTNMCKAASTKRKIKEFRKNGYQLRKV